MPDDAPAAAFDDSRAAGDCALPFGIDLAPPHARGCQVLEALLAAGFIDVQVTSQGRGGPVTGVGLRREGQARRTFIAGRHETAAQWVASAELMCPRPWARAEAWSLRSLLRGPLSPVSPATRR